MKKIAGLELTTVTDPDLGLPVRVSTSVRKLYRKMDEERYGMMRNERLNLIIAEHFSSNANHILHYFPLTKGTESVTGEIRSVAGGSLFYVSAIRSSSIDILIIQNGWKEPSNRKE